MHTRSTLPLQQQVHRMVTTFLLLTVFIAPAFSQSAEEAAIKKVITAETDAFFRRDLQTLKTYWSTDNKVSRMIISPTSVNYLQGAEKGEAELANYTKSNPEPMKDRPRNENYQFRVNGNLAWVEYDAYMPTPGGEPTHTHEYRVMVKEGGQWKIANQIVTWPSEYMKTDAVTIENELNRTGYKLLAAKRVNEAIELFQLNVKQNPNAWNTYDSLGEAYAIAGNRAEAIKNYELSIQLNPKNEMGKEALARLKQ